MILQNLSTHLPTYMTSHLKNRVYKHCHDHLGSLAQTDTAKLQIAQEIYKALLHNLGIKKEMIHGQGM